MVTAASAPATVDWFFPKSYKAADDAATLQATLDACASAGGGTVYLPRGEFTITRPLTLRPHVNIQGASAYASIINYTGDQTKSWLSGADIEDAVYRDFGVNGPSWGSPPTGAGHCFDLTRSASPDVHFVTFENVSVQNCGGSAFRISNPIVTRLDRSVATNCGRGFELYGIPNGAAGTSVALSACYANNCAREGFSLSKMTYSTLTACAADGNAVGYHLYDCDAVAVIGCGAEGTMAKNKLDGTSFLVENSRGVTVTSVFTYGNAADAVRFSSSQSCTVTGAVESDPKSSARSSIRTIGSTVQSSANMGVSPVLAK